ncbi:MAG: flagellar hook-associated protein FlgL [Archangiaceae bacterium]|nr:flagellar hook-associated protein FlgL [Archangiaceae bacterium]
MRVSDRWMYEQNTSTLQRQKTAHAKALGEVSSGTRVTHPWEDPAAAGRAVAHEANTKAFSAVGTAVQRASDELNSIDAGLGDVVESLSRARELAVQLSNDSYSASERAGAAAEVTGLFNSVVASLNREVGGRYVFGGYKDGSAPFDAAGNFLGDGNVRKVEVAKGVWQDASIATDAAIKGVGGGTDVLATLQNLATALSTNNTTNVRASLDLLSSSISQVSQARSQAGAHAALFDVAQATARAGRDDEQAQLSSEVDADPFDAATRLAQAEASLEASIESVSRSGKLTLLGKM